MQVAIEMKNKPFRELRGFEKDEYLFKKFWGAPKCITSDKLKELIIQNTYLPKYGIDEPLSIFGEYEDWNHHLPIL